ncbi:MAG: glycosyltransferase [Candidatus Krumholzibacteria bacterium]|nr:glycosyltransferase [Candidatus Krumholzibacteria bacterium]
MRWALLGPFPPYRGGISHYGTFLARALEEEDEVRALNFRRLYPRLLFPGKTQLDESASSLRYPSERMLDSLSPASWEKAARFLAKEKPDALIFQWWHPFFGPAYAWIARRMAKLSPESRRLMLCHNVLPHESSFVDRALMKLGRSPMQGFLAHSEGDGEALRKLYPEALVRVHPHPPYHGLSDSSMDSETARGKLGIDPGEKILLFFGLVRQYKGLDLALEALALSDDPTLRLWVVGEFYEKQAETEKQIERLKLQGRVRLVNRYVPNDEIPLYFQAADLLLLPYRSATQSGIVEIAHASSRPVLATDVGGLSAQIRHRETGLLVPPEDPVALANAIEQYFREGLEAGFVKAIRAELSTRDWASLARCLRELAVGS